MCLGGGFTGIQGVVVGLGVAKAAAFTALVGNKWCCTFSRGKAAAARGAFGVRSADTCDELGSCSGCEEGDWGGQNVLVVEVGFVWTGCSYS